MEYKNYLEKFRQQHILRGNSPRTIQAYTDNCKLAFEYIQKDPLQINEDDLKGYIFHLIDKGYEAKTCNQKIYSLKSFFKLLKIGGKDEPSRNLPRQKEKIKVFDIPCKKEVEPILNSLSNLKHKTILAVTYSAGMRLEEVRLLKVTDINSGRMVIHVNGKGNKQRLVPLCQKVLDLLREYYKSYRPGGHSYTCDTCDYEKNAYNSCRNRHCPKCQGLARLKWVECRMEELLPVPYFHAVLTVPKELNPFALRNKEAFYNMQQKAAAETFSKLSQDPKHITAALAYLISLSLPTTSRQYDIANKLLYH